MTRYIFITGGVVSSLGKGLATASLGALLQARGYKVRLRKLDPYLNIDPGTMSPIQHGEVFVTTDGGETDLDLGHYERFTGVEAKKNDNMTAGKIYANLLAKERRGDYLGKTVQVIPHVTDLIKEFILKDTKNSDFVLCEIGGTIGDIEGLPFYEAIRQLGYELGKSKVIYVHVTLLPYIKAASELKTKPTQHSVKELRSIGIDPNILLCRSEYPISESDLTKIALFCNVKEEAVIPALDVSNIYEAPIAYHEKGFDKEVLEYFGLENNKPDLTLWREYVANLNKFEKVVKIAIIGKYVKLLDAYKSILESFNHASNHLGVKVELTWINSRHLTEENIVKKLAKIDGILVPGGFGEDGTEGKILAINYARTNNIPFFGICFGMQLAIIEIARNLCDLPKANSSEFDDSGDNVIGLMTEWMRESEIEKRKKTDDLGGTMRLGSYKAVITPKSLAYNIYGKATIHERHRHRYEVNINYKAQLEKAGIVFSGMSPDGNLTEIIELTGHKWFVAVQFHPEFKSKPFEPHPLFVGFVKASIPESVE